MERLHPLKNDRPDLTTKWCGPAVVCSLTGLPYSKVIATFREVMPGVQSDTGVQGTTKWQVEKVLEKLGFKLIERDHFSRRCLSHQEQKAIEYKTGRYQMYSSDSRPTLAHYAAKNREKFQKHAMLVEVTGHWTSLFGRRGFDNHTPGYKPVSLRKLNFRRAKVVGSWSVVKIGEEYTPSVVLPPPPIPPKSPFKKIKQARIRRANRLANEIAAGIDFSAQLAAVDRAIAVSERRLKNL
jgi:hypothetical protein